MASAELEALRVSVVYLRPGLMFQRSVVLTAPATVANAIEASGILAELPELRMVEFAVGVFSRLCSPEDALHDGDRVEVYRPLTVDPKEARRIRVAIRRRRKSTPAASR